MKKEAAIRAIYDSVTFGELDSTGLTLTIACTYVTCVFVQSFH